MYPIDPGCGPREAHEGRGRPREGGGGEEGGGALRLARALRSRSRCSALRTGTRSTDRIRGVPQGEARRRRNRAQDLRGGSAVSLLSSLLFYL